MKIGDVVNIQIDGAVRSCIILDKKTYHGVGEVWNGTSIILREYYGRNGLHPNTNFYYDESILMNKIPVYYELMYGDNRAWIVEQILKLYVKEI